MAELWKDKLNRESLQKFALVVKASYGAFPVEIFIDSVMDETWNSLELMARRRQICINLGKFLPDDYSEAIDILDKVISSYNALEIFCIPGFIELYGQDDENWDLSIGAMERFTQYASCEFVVRPFIIKNEKRITELDMLFRKTYEDNAVGKLSDERFAQLSGAYESEQADLKQQNAILQSEVDSFDADSAKADRFIELVHKYTDFTELTASMINEFVDKVLIYEGDKSSGKRVQRIDIYFNFIGVFDVPAVEIIPTAEEIEAERKQDELRAKRKKYNRRYQAKRQVKDGVLTKVEPSEEKQQKTKPA